MKPLPTIERLNYLFTLEENGTLVRRVSVPNSCCGSIAGWPNGRGYLGTFVDGYSYPVHRIVFALANGRWPVGQIDHINGIRSDNRPANLREVSPRENMQNMARHREGKLVGASWHKHTRKWRAQARHAGKKVHIGLFLSEQGAHAAHVAFLLSNNLKLLS